MRYSRQEQIDMYMKYMNTIEREGKDEFIEWLINDTVMKDCPLSFLIHMADFSASGMVEKTIDYKEKALQEHIKKINGN